MIYSDSAIEELKNRLCEKAMRSSTPKKYSGDMLEAFEVIKQLQSSVKKQIPQKIIPTEKYNFSCPSCNTELDLESEDIYIYDMAPPKHCEECGQALDWESVL